MILIDAVYINMGGGKVLLDYLIQSLERSGLAVHYLLDERIQGKHPHIENTCTYLTAGLKTRHVFYKSHQENFSSVLCFASIPPTIRLNAKVYTYFHQLLYLKVPKNSGFKFTLMARLKSAVSRLLKGNSDYWLVQSESVKSQLQHKYQLKEQQLKVLPFYPAATALPNTTRIPNSFTYVSLPASYKNHQRLLEAFQLFYHKNKTGQLNLTVNDQFPALLQQIAQLQQQGVPIINHGFLAQKELAKLYSQSAFVVYPSLAESFGLGLVEALEYGCEIIAADLPYVQAICKPALTFNPLNTQDMAGAFEQATKGKYQKSKQLVFNQIDQLINLLQS
ncbi:glycosyltransferase [Pedobacter sp. MC2016-14]|uniref:glycosyltransferase n=1 Tax=Pedobacter sp. MC2016-14 TaxID=2897327 RepID=UPI001E62B28A|nr:glycosyltransferase [Pedobacter sp. MC2016-14]MCD0486890.1 glycosyltransferase [Pedobacter sp. MC2016-14]